ncbi:uncharacterized protein LOC128397822 [Panonychus citri]|uniref:uncharacterized protein LOC128397822 n=1 Tax=Panonychus citri TaxID=50023 RepID=UPI002307D602|nr:uncharacterized protein LOC128397822 [Panonychus citri]XP_053214557.1 uncharacterized protein LOC128397822 [Panonychus citri]
MTLVRFIKNSRNNDTLIAGDFIFRRNKCRDEKVYWKCRKTACPAKITTHNGKVMGHFLKHNHDDTNQEEITRLEGLSPPTNYQQIAQDEEQVTQVIVSTGEPFGEYSFNSSGSSYIETSGEEAQLQQQSINPQLEASTSIAKASTSSSLQSAVKEISESQKKIEELVNNLISSTESDSLQTENLRLKAELEEVVRTWSAEMTDKEMRLQEETRKSEAIQRDLELQLNAEREEKTKLEMENEQLKQLIQSYEMQDKEEEDQQTFTLEEVTEQLCHQDDV